MRTVYPTTRAGYFDTEDIAKAKWLQQKRSPSAAAAGSLAEPRTTKSSYYDTRLKTIQKILKKLQ